MNRPFLLPELTVSELVELQRLLRAERTPASMYRRCNLLWQLAAGYSLVEASRISGLHYTNSHMWLKRFLSSGLSGLNSKSRPGRPRTYREKVDEVVIRAATSKPEDLGLEFSTWSLAKLEEFLQRRKITREISRETIRRILHRHGLRFLTGQTWCESDDPEFEQKKTRS